MNDKLNTIENDTDTILGFVSFMREMGIINLEAPAVTKAAQFYASYKDGINDKEEHLYYVALGKKELLTECNDAVPSHYAARVRYVLSR